MLNCVVHTEAEITRLQSVAACDDGHKRFKTPTHIFTARRRIIHGNSLLVHLSYIKYYATPKECASCGTKKEPKRGMNTSQTV